MNDFFAELLLYGPPAIAAILYYFKQHKKQAKSADKNYIFLFLVPLVIFTGGVAVWSFVVLGLLSLLGS